VLLVIAQGVLGGLRVRWHMDNLGILHGTTAQVFFILVCALALFTSRWWLDWTETKQGTPVSDCLRTQVLGATLLIFAQLLLGATMRHQHAGLAIPDFPLSYGKVWPDTSDAAIAQYNAQRVEVVSENPITAFQIILQMVHRLMALVILLAVTACAWRAVRHLGGRDLLAKVAVGWLFLLLVQIGLGIATVLSNKAADIATLHVMTGALSLVTGALWCVIAFRRRVSSTNLVAEKAISGGLKTRPA
jgi:cytochrome c oxidase assembly protein subunit 15